MKLDLRGKAGEEVLFVLFLNVKNLPGAYMVPQPRE
jgi:hypothetical protein